jgi:hypothetical protein
MITVQAKVTIGGTDYYTVPQAVSFGNGPLYVFRAPESGTMNWDAAYKECNNDTTYTGDHSSGWSSGAYVGGPGGNDTDSATGKMPTRAEVKAVAVNTGQGAAYAAGWPNYWLWTGEARGAGDAFTVYLDDGNNGGGSVSDYYPVACRR